MDKKLIKPKKCLLLDDEGKVIGYKSYKETLRRNSVKDAYKILQCNVLRGFNPKYYIVGHFNDGYGNKRLEQRRLNPYYVERDLLEVKRKLLQLLYGNNWMTMTKRARVFFTIEYGNSKIKPHFNLLIEQPPLLCDDVTYLSKVFNKYLPSKVKCLWKDSSKVSLIDHHNNDNDIISLNSYIHKETNIRNNTIPVKVNDYIR
tara:strand:- start:3364 stop:3969 length:606 start_codon:yes stop_codon:yes gene_type:complete